tara:strand:+ start:420 stop:962 length:543 start_codon:yes stop_codon:yes gene_type:complete
MANHVLSLEVPTVMNSCIMRVVDTSVYSSLIDVNCTHLNITVPGYGFSIQLNVTENFTKTITACDLNLQTEDCGEKYANLPDGVYIIKYSVSPNDVVFVTYNHLRITDALIKYNKILCDIDVSACDPPADIKKKLEQLRLIKMYLEAAKAKVEYCHEPQKGMTLYNYACKLLGKMNCTNC